MKIAGKKFIVIGLGKSGLAAIRFLNSRGADVTANDSKSVDELGDIVGALEDEHIEVVAGGHPQKLLNDADYIILSPGVPLRIEPLQKAISKGVPVIAEIELASRFLKDKLVAITGSNGKSTTTALTAHILREAGLNALECGNIGKPLIDLVESTSKDRILVVELSSFQLETIVRFRPQIATVLNVTPDHLDRYSSFEAYKLAKYRIFENQQITDQVIINADEEHAGEIESTANSRAIVFGSRRMNREGVYLHKNSLVYFNKSREYVICSRDSLSLAGPHNLSNSLAASAMAITAGADIKKISKGLQTFHALTHRLEPVREINGISFVNDSKATNVDSTSVALQSFSTPIHVILGGKDKDSDFTVLNPFLLKHASEVILIGDASEVIDKQLDKNVKRKNCNSLQDAVVHGFKNAKPGEVVLLSPACASFDMFDNFEHRGEEFKRIVNELE